MAEQLFVLSGHTGGITQVQFSRDGTYLYSGARKDGSILCWDVRYTVGEVYRLARDTSNTNQRIAFDIEPGGRHLATGGEDGCVRVFDLTTGELKATHRAAPETVNGFGFHPMLPLVATASGERIFRVRDEDDDEDQRDAENEGTLSYVGTSILCQSAAVVEVALVSVCLRSMTDLETLSSTFSARATGSFCKVCKLDTSRKQHDCLLASWKDTFLLRVSDRSLCRFITCVPSAFDEQFTNPQLLVLAS